MLVTMKAILDEANRHNYAVAAPNVWSELDTRAVIAAAEELRAPLILDVAYPANPDFRYFGKICCDLAAKASVPIAVNLDHGADEKQILEAFQAGFTSVMIDRSAASYEENVTMTRKVVEMAHALHISVEAELGHVGMANCYEKDSGAALSDPQLAKQFVEETQVDCLAIAIGTAHGAYPKGLKPSLDFNRLAKIKQVLPIPLVLHGSSGTDSRELKQACLSGINKVNIANDLCKAVCTAVQAADFEGNKAYEIADVIYMAVKNKMKAMILLYGSQQKA